MAALGLVVLRTRFLRSIRRKWRLRRTRIMRTRTIGERFAANAWQSPFAWRHMISLGIRAMQRAQLHTTQASSEASTEVIEVTDPRRFLV